jgi:RNA polymerase sigma-70 factor (ECF subfamily)
MRMGGVDETRLSSKSSEPSALVASSLLPQPGPAMRAMKVASAEEGQILVRHREGDSDAFSELLACYRAPVYAYLIRCGVDPSQQDDLFQDVFLKVHGAAHAYEPEQPLHPWLFTIVANTVRSHFRRARVRKLVQLDRAPEPATTADHGQQQLEAEETVGWLSEAVSQLPLAQREVVLLCCVENWEQKDVAKALSIPVNTVKTLLRRARLDLAKGLARRQGALKREVSS